MFTSKKIDGTTAGATATVTTSPTCGLTGCGVKVGKGGGVPFIEKYRSEH